MRIFSSHLSSDGHWEVSIDVNPGDVPIAYLDRSTTCSNTGPNTSYIVKFIIASGDIWKLKPPPRLKSALAYNERGNALPVRIGLVPFLFATGPGSEVQRPLAIVVIGGLVTSTMLTLVMVPVLYGWFEGKEKRNRAGA